MSHAFPASPGRSASAAIRLSLVCRLRFATALLGKGVATGGLMAALVGAVATPAGAVTFPNACKNSTTADNDQISVTMTANAPTAATPGGAVTLSNISQSLTLPSRVFVAGYNLGLLPQGVNNIPATVITRIEATDTLEQAQDTNTAPGSISTAIIDPDGVPGTGDESATNGVLNVTYVNQAWTAGSGGPIDFREDTVTPIGAAAGGGHTGGIRLTMTIGGFLPVRYGCSPGTVTGPAPGVITFDDPAVAFASTPPANDAQSQAQEVFEVAALWTLTAATPDGAAQCGMSTGQPDVWFRHTALFPGRLVIDTCSSNDYPSTDAGTDTVLSLHSPDGLLEYACNDDWHNSATDPSRCLGLDSGAQRDSVVARNVVKGESVLIRVANYPGSPASVFQLYVQLQAADSDGDGLADNFDNCTQLPNNGETGTGPAQNDTNGDGYGNMCDADLDNSGLTTAADFNLLRSCLNLPASTSALCAAADMNGSALVTATDFNLLRARLNTAPGPSGLHP